MCAKVDCKDHTPEQRKVVEDFDKLILKNVTRGPTASIVRDSSHPYCCAGCGRVFIPTPGMCATCTEKENSNG